VDDNPDNQAIITFLLQEAGAEVAVADHGQAGVDAAARAAGNGTPFHLIVMDIRMPVMDGYTATARLRQQGVTTPIIALTAHAMAGDEERCRAAGCNGYVSKPIVPERLLGELHRHLAAHDAAPAQAPSAFLPSAMANNPRFAPLLKEYRAHLPEIIDQLDVAQQSKDRDRLDSLVHRIHGTAANYGFPQISAIAGQCEAMIRGGEPLAETVAPLAQLVGLLRLAAREPEGQG
jgi:CheY-like chemotaxis protein/HPt (histidine-containing phosphotransfer) domain-containing protein